MYFFLGTPDRVRWLSPAQKVQAKARIATNLDGSKEVRRWNWSQCRECLVDPQVYFACGYVFLVSRSSYATRVEQIGLTSSPLQISLPNGGITTFQSLILKGLGFDSLMSTLLGIPISIFSLVLAVSDGSPGVNL